MRLCANTGCTLHLVEPFSFTLDDARLRRAGLDYRERAVFRVHRSWQDFLSEEAPDRVVAFTGHASTSYADLSYRPGDALVFGKESVGLPESVLSDPGVAERVRIPMTPEGRSLNLASAAAIAVYEGWRQTGFAALPSRTDPVSGEDPERHCLGQHAPAEFVQVETLVRPVSARHGVGRSGEQDVRTRERIGKRRDEWDGAADTDVDRIAPPTRSASPAGMPRTWRSLRLTTPRALGASVDVPAHPTGRRTRGGGGALRRLHRGPGLVRSAG